MMRNCILAMMLLIVVVSPLSIRAPEMSYMDDHYNAFDLLCDDAHGEVVYAFNGLPKGFVMEGNSLVYQGGVALSGEFPVKITARDASGAMATTTVILNMNLSGSASAAYTSEAGLAIAEAGLGQISTGGSINAGDQVLTLNGETINLGQSINLNLDSTGASVSVGGSTGSSGTTVTRADVDQILSKYSVDTSVEHSSEITNYPTPVILTGQLPTVSTTSAQVLSIATGQAEVSNSAVGYTTEYDRNITYLFNKQTKISQTIANLLNIIRKGTANRNQAEADITLYKRKHEEAIQVHEEISLDIAQKEGKIRGIKEGIVATEGELNILKVDLTTIDDKISTTKANGMSLTHELTVALSNKDGINTQISTTQSTIDSLTVRLDSQSQNCDATNQIVVGLQANISTLLASIATIDIQVDGIDANIDAYLTEISALEAKIRALKIQINNAKDEKQRLINLNYTVPQQVANLKAQITIQQSKCKETDGSVFAQLTATRQTLSDLQIQLNDNNKDIAVINGSISMVRVELNELINTRDGIIVSINQVSVNLRTLKISLPKYEAELSECYMRGNRALKIISSSNSSLLASTARFRIESDALTVANYHLQIARTEQQECSIQINLILQENTAGLPFPSAPGESGLSGELVSVNIVESINAFLMRAYGSSLHLNAFSRYLGGQYLYTFGHSHQNRKGCAPIVLSSESSLSSETSASSSMMAMEGKVKSILNENEWIIETEEGEQTLSMDHCTIRLANVENYSVNIGDMLAWKGHIDGGIWHASQLTCFH